MPRVRNVVANHEVPLHTYERLQAPYADDGETLRKLLHGLSTHKHHESAALAAEAFGLSASNLSKRFKRGSAGQLKALQTRRLSGWDFVVIFLDAKRYADDGLMVALGVTLEGTKVVLGVEQLHSENAKAIEQWFDRLLARGLTVEEGILLIIDGSKGIRKAISRTFDLYAVVQRCRWHNSHQILRWTATGLLDIEPRLNKIQGARY